MNGLRWERNRMRDEKGQMTVELAAAFPVMLAIALIAVNGLTFLSLAAAFDNELRTVACAAVASPGYGEDAQACRARAQAALEEAFDANNVQVSVAVEDVAGGHTSVKGALEFHPTLFGLGLRREFFGVSLPPLRHEARLVVDRYKPGVFL